MIRLENVLKTYFQDVLKTSSKRLENILKTFLQDVLKTSWKLLENVLRISWRRFYKTSWRCFKEVLARRLEDVLKTSWRRLEDVWPRWICLSWSRRLEESLNTYDQKRIYWYWPRCLENVLKMSSEEVWVKRIYLSWWRHFEDVFWSRRQKTSSRRLHQDECLLGYFYVQTSQQPTLKMFSLSQPFRQLKLHQVTRGFCEDWHCLNSLFFLKIWIVITGGSQSLIPYRSGQENWSTAGSGLWWRCLQLEWQTTQSTFSHTLNLLSLLSYPTNTITRTHSLLEIICLTWFSS